MTKHDIRLQDPLVVTRQGDEPYTWEQRVLTAEEPGLLMPGSWVLSTVDVPSPAGELVTSSKMLLLGVIIDFDRIASDRPEVGETEPYDVRIFNAGQWPVTLAPGELIAHLLED